MNEATIVVMPTYNEAAALPAVVARLRVAVPDADLLIVDDSSPDGTGAIADRLSMADDHVHVLHRAAKQGLGPAYIAGFSWALRHGYRIIVQSDADGSHRPEDVPALLSRLDTSDVVIGSRWTEGGSTPGWAAHRRVLSPAGSRDAGWMLRLPQRDITGGLRAFRAGALRAVLRSGISSVGYCFQIEMLAGAVALGARVTEVPIRFDPRSAGRSKMSGRIVLEALREVTVRGVRRRWQDRVSSRVTVPPRSVGNHARG